MNITELEKITKQIKKYQLEDEIRDIENWLRKLNEKQIKNFVNISIEPHQLRGILKSKSLLINEAALNGDYYLEDIKFVNDAKSVGILMCLSFIAQDIDSLKSEYHREDMKLITNAKSDEIARYLGNVSMDVDLLKMEYHREYMKLIANGKSIKDAEKIYDRIIKEKYRIFSMTFQEKIDAIHQNAIEYTDGDTTKELNDSVFTLK